MSDETQFLDNLKGSALANILSALLFFSIYIVREKCKHSKCEGNSFCCRFKCKDDEDDAGDEEEGRRGRKKGNETFERQKTFRFPRQAKSQVQKLHIRVDSGVHEKHPQVVPSDGRGTCSVDTQLAEEKGNV